MSKELFFQSGSRIVESHFLTVRMEFRNQTGKKFKVTRRIPEMSIAKTKVFRSKEKAKRQFDD